MTTEPQFSEKIQEILDKYFNDDAQTIFNSSDLLKYITNKTKSANSGSKSRSSFGNLYAIYVLLEDYKLKGFIENPNYSKYEGATFGDLFSRQRELPFGSKLQNHALNHRLNEEFRKFFPTTEYIPIVRDLKKNRYWFNENLIIVKVKKKNFNLCEAILEIIEEYIKSKKDSFDKFIEACETLKTIIDHDKESAQTFILSLLSPNSDARLFEIVSYSILKYFYLDQKLYWGFDTTSLNEDYLKLYKTGRTNANDGGIDFVMKPLGRFFQVTETVEVTKYFLDIDKIERYPITFVIKSMESSELLRNKLELDAHKKYGIDVVVHSYMMCIEEIINIPNLIEIFDSSTRAGHLNSILDEIIIQSKVEFNYDTEN
ncbi:restriction endonuclease [Leptospira sp. 2 VSF19]|uniref:Restriction endonuclease n=1 Tax=Leptospira soteropolitanensis TaxID=2950025 RepID=A0AAW5VPM4_9LEPT|nr:restriction endonuclease [Leptospira soteropolitanensis]MCW7494702.1 restriction endonuclease [Leptospira soteropolitanensis]MCW7502253.1 restriction endonuclease [Leptospira soteropolitanensis]MCW7524528.1 restriction endonuclease [Leptospira soteropolitanensis]MCW7528370.1 restriction endonuclease [Leptospira soteropolitanensis]MCW7532261.1 restriction endonuclease [Leptospira soteropolitanensis]